MTNAMPEQDEGKADNAETRSLSKLVKEETMKFLSETSLHGVQNVTRDERRRFGRTVWLLAVLAMAGWLMYTLTYQFTNYFSYPHVTTTTASQAKSYQLPTVTICLKDPLDRGRLASLPHSSILERYFDTSLKPLNWSDPHVQAVMSNVTMQVMEVASFSTEEVLGKESIILSAFTDVIVRMSVLDALWGGVPSRCYTANTTARGKQMLKTTDSLSLYFRVPQATVIPFEDVGGMKVYVHQPWQLPLMMKYTEVAFGTAVSLKLTTTKFLFLPAPYRSMGGSDCVVDVDSGDWPTRLRHYHTYSYFNCVREHVYLRTATRCGCRSLGDVANDQLPNCTLMQVHSCYHPTQSSTLLEVLADTGPCLWECGTTWYEAKSTAVPFLDRRQRLGAQAANLTLVDEVKINVMYDSNLIFTTQHVPAVTLDDIYSTVGGQMGLFLGASLLTVTEMVEHVCYILWTTLKYMFTKRKTSP